MKQFLSLQELDAICAKDFPNGFPGYSFITYRSEVNDLFGDDAVERIGDSFLLPSKWLYDDSARWAYWHYPRFRLEADAILFKLRFG